MGNEKSKLTKLSSFDEEESDDGGLGYYIPVPDTPKIKTIKNPRGKHARTQSFQVYTTTSVEPKEEELKESNIKINRKRKLTRNSISSDPSTKKENKLQTLLTNTPPPKETNFSNKEPQLVKEETPTRDRAMTTSTAPATPTTHLKTTTVSMTECGIEGEIRLETQILKSTKTKHLALENLTKLDMNDNEIETILDIHKCIKLTYVDLHMNHISNVKWLEPLTQITYLNLSENELSAEVFDELSVDNLLPNLKSLNLSCNDLGIIPTFISTLPSLKELILEEIELDNDADLGVLSNISTLTILNLANNDIETIPDSLKNLHFLKHLDLSDNLLSHFPQVILSLSEMQDLDLQGNAIEKLPESLNELSKLEEIDLSDNPIRELPLCLGKMKSHLRYINLSDSENFKFPPPQIIERGELAIMDYINMVERCGGVVKYAHKKIAVLGSKSVGKTFLINKIVSKQKHKTHPPTQRVEIFEHIIEDINFSFYDFPGADQFHSIYPFFFSNNAIYIICIAINDVLKMETIERWYNSVMVHAPESHIIFCLFYENSTTHFDQQQYPFLSEFLNKPSVLGFYDLSDITDKDIQNLVDCITLTMKQELSQQHPKLYTYLKDEFMELRKENNYIHWSKLKSIVKKFNPSSNQLMNALRTLHDWGVIIMHFPKRKTSKQTNLKKKHAGIIILHPQWISNIIYSLYSLQKHTTTGILPFKVLDEHLTTFCNSKRDRKLLIDMIYSFEIAYPSTTHHTFFPMLVKEKPGPNVKDSILNHNGTIVQHNYSFSSIPLDFFSRLQVRLSRAAEPQSIWKTGCIIEKNHHIAIIEIDSLTISITVAGNYPPNLLSICTNILDTLISELGDSVSVCIMITCPNCLSTSDFLYSSPSQQFGKFPLKKLYRYKESNNNSITCYNCHQNTFINDVISQVHPQIEALTHILAQGEMNNNQDRKEFIHRQYLSHIHKHEVPESSAIFIPIVNDKVISMYQLCEYPGCWHFVPNAKYEVDKEYFFGDSKALSYLQNRLHLLMTILKGIGPPDDLHSIGSSWEEIQDSITIILNYSDEGSLPISPIWGTPQSISSMEKTIPYTQPLSNLQKEHMLFDIAMVNPSETIEPIVDDSTPLRSDQFLLWIKEHFKQDIPLHPFKLPTFVNKIWVCDDHMHQLKEQEPTQFDEIDDLKQTSIKIIKRIGMGSQGTVYYGKIFQSIPVAIKCLPVQLGIFNQNLDETELAKALDEIKLLRKLHHPNIVLYLGGYFDPTQKNLSIVMEYVPKLNLHRLIHNKHFFNETNPTTLLMIKTKLALGISRGMEYLHAQHIVHRDLKTENILITQNMIPKISDFGLSLILDDNSSGPTSQIGTMQYMAPEIFKGEKHGQPIDVYSMGVILFELFSGCKPYANLSYLEISQRVIKGVPPISNVLLPDAIQVIITKCLSSASHRPSFKQVSKELHAFLNSVKYS